MDLFAKIARKVDMAASAVSTEMKSLVATKKNVDCVFIVGPNEPGVRDDLRRLAESRGVSYAFVGNGDKPVTKEMILAARRSGVIGPDTEVFGTMHGGLSPGAEGVQHGLELDPDADAVSPNEFISWLRAPLGKNHGDNDDDKAWGGNIHLLSCHVGKFRHEFKPSEEGQQGLWEQGQVFLHGSGKMLYTGTSLDDVDTVMGEIVAARKDGGERPEGAQIMRALMERQSDTVTLMGGSLDAPLVLHAPKSVAEAEPGYLQAQLRRMEAEGKLGTLEGRIAGSDRGRDALLNAKASLTARESAPNQKSNVLFTRIVHLKTREKLDRLLSDLTSTAGLAQIRDRAGLTPLILVATLPRVKGAKVGKHEIAEALIKSGADVNARDKFGKTAIHYAVQNGHAELVKTLLKMGADPNLVDGEGNSLFHLVTHLGKDLGLQILRGGLQDKVTLDFRKKNKEGETALSLAQKYASDDGDRRVLVELENISKKASAGA